MKKLIFCLVVLFVLPLCLSAAGDDVFQIMKLNTPHITVGGKTLKVGDTFKDPSVIVWEDYKQSMEVKNLSTGMLYRFSKQAFESKGDVKSIHDFYLRTNSASSRDTDRRIELYASPVKGEFPDKRIALVIGNSNYSHLSYLRNAQKDAADVATTLMSLGFDVLQAYECNYEDMRSALNRFSALAADYDVALFYYAGHGLQEDGKNYLIPVNAKLEYRSELSGLMSCDDIVDRMDAARTPSRLIFLDACRNAKKSWSRDVSEGLARMEGTPGSVIVFSTQSGKVALDGEGDNSPFAASLIQNIVKPDIDFLGAMNATVRETYALTGQRQYPLLVGTLFTDFRFNPGARQIQTDVQAVPVRSRPEPEPLPQADITFSAFGFDVQCTPAVLKGGTLVFDVIFTNNTQHELRPAETAMIEDIMLYASSSQVFNSNQVSLSVGGRSFTEADFPRGMPVALRVRVQGYPAGAKSVPMFNLTLRNMDMSRLDSRATLKIKNIPIVSDPTVLETPYAETYKTRNIPDPMLGFSVWNVDAVFTRAQRAGTTVQFGLQLTNRTGKDLQPYIDPIQGVSIGDNKYGTAVHVSPSKILLIDDGMEIIAPGGGSALSRFNLPDGMTVMVLFRLHGIPKDQTYIPLAHAIFCNLDPDTLSGLAPVYMYNIPIEN